MTTKAAEQAKRWRKNHPDRYRDSQDKQLARRRALAKLAKLHPDDFDRLYRRELKEGRRGS